MCTENDRKRFLHSVKMLGGTDDSFISKKQNKPLCQAWSVKSGKWVGFFPQVLLL